MSKERKKKTQDRVERLDNMLREARTMLIVLQDSPDPDAIASAGALRVLANAMGDCACTLIHGGVIGRAENQALVRYLGLNLRPACDVDPAKFDLVAMVDTQPSAGNNALPNDMTPDIVIDHHPVRRATRRSPFTDIRSGYGATSAIMYEYLAESGVDVEPPLATALVYGICSDTQDLGREATGVDISAYLSLYPIANKRMLGRIRRAPVPREYFGILAAAINNAELVGEGVMSHLGRVAIPDMIPEVADLLLRNEGTTWTLASGIYQDHILLSLRTTDNTGDAGRIAKRLAGRKGTGGGHQMMAGGQIPLDNPDDEDACRKTVETLHRRFLRFLNADRDEAEALVPGNDSKT